jgi:hypothetical protein
MVGPWGLEPQTSTVSICWADWVWMRWSEYKWYWRQALRSDCLLTTLQAIGLSWGRLQGLA